jgi:hypothetical protein
MKKVLIAATAVLFVLITITTLAFQAMAIAKSWNRSPGTGAAQTLPQTDRQRIENYGALFVRAINAGNPEAQTKAVPEVFAQAFVQSVGEARLAGLFAKLRQNYGEMEYHHSEMLEAKFGERISRILHVYAKAKGAQGWKDFQLRIEDNNQDNGAYDDLRKNIVKLITGWR